MYYLVYVAAAIDHLLIALDSYVFSYNSYGPRIKEQGPRSCGSGPVGPSFLSLRLWSRAQEWCDFLE